MAMMYRGFRSRRILFHLNAKKQNKNKNNWKSLSFNSSERIENKIKQHHP